MAGTPGVGEGGIEAGSTVNNTNKETAQSTTELAKDNGNSKQDIEEMKNIATVLTEKPSLLTDGQREGLRTIANGGDVVKDLTSRGREIRKIAESLTGDEKQIKLAEGYDQEIGGLQIQKSQEKNPKKIQALETQIKTLQQERDKLKIDNESIPNQFDQLAFILSPVDAKFVAEQIKNGSPLIAVNEVIKHIAINKDARTNLIASLKGSSFFSEEQMSDFEKQIGKLVMNKNVEKGAKTAGKIALGACLMSLLMAYMSSIEKKQRMG